MIRSLLSVSALVCATVLQAQTYFYIDQIVVDPQPATPADNISIDLVGNLSGGGAYIASASAAVNGNVVTITIVAGDNGGITVLIPYTHTVQVGQLSAGTYTIVFNAVNVGDFAPSPQHQFVVEGGPTACDSLIVESISWHAFNDTMIVVHVLNNSATLFDYPNFILFDEDGDTLAVETVNFFGIAGESWHQLHLHPDGTVPVDPYYGQLELWTGFTTELACEWMPFIDLCPPEPCAMIIPMVQNLGGALAIGTYSWSMFDADMNSVGSGTFTMTDVLQMDSDTLCLPPGEYQMACYAQQPPTGGNPVYSVSTQGWISGPSQQVSFDLPVLMPFTFYEPCIDGTNNVAEVHGNTFQTFITGDQLRVQDQGPLGTVEVVDARGRRVAGTTTTATSISFATGDLGKGVYLVRAGSAVVRVMIAE